MKRYQTEGHYHFLTFSCYHRLPYLNDDDPRSTFLNELETLRKRHQFFFFGYAHMPELVHLLLTEPKLQRLDNTLRVLKGETSKLFQGVSAHDEVQDQQATSRAKGTRSQHRRRISQA